MNGTLTFTGVGKTFATRNGAVEALRHVDLVVPRDQVTAIVGPSGCGKSTLLHIASGLDTQYTGQMLCPGAQDRTAYLFQSPRLLPWLTTVQNVAFVLEARGQPARDAVATAHRFLEMVGLAGFERSFPTQLSGGMQQRVSLARALAVEPALMLMDEPFAALDELTARRMRAELLTLFTHTPRTVLFVTHNITEAVFLGDRVVVMTPRPGRVRAEVTVHLPRPRQYDDPEVASVAREVARNLDWD